MTIRCCAGIGTVQTDFLIRPHRALSRLIRLEVLTADQSLMPASRKEFEGGQEGINRDADGSFWKDYDKKEFGGAGITFDKFIPDEPREGDQRRR
jgi:hypothetical protein